MIIGLQLIALVFALIMIYVAYLHYRRGEINGFEMLFWLLAWLGSVVITVFPNAIRAFSETIAISRALDLAILGAFGLLIPMVYSSYIKTKKLEKKVEEFIRQESIRNMKSDKKLK